MLEYFNQFMEIEDLRYILGRFPSKLSIPIEGTNLCYKTDQQGAKFMELSTTNGTRHILYSDIESELDMNEVINRIRSTQEYIILVYVV